jgi:hypothetical protein
VCYLATPSTLSLYEKHCTHLDTPNALRKRTILSLRHRVCLTGHTPRLLAPRAAVEGNTTEREHNINEKLALSGGNKSNAAID